MSALKGKIVDAIVATCNDRKYHKTKANGYGPGNLMSWFDCQYM